MSAKAMIGSAILPLLLVLSVSAQDGFVGYANRNFDSGSNFFNNPVLAQDNTLSGLISLPPEGTIVSLWDPATSTFDTNSTFTNGSWTTELTLLPGTGALVIAPSAFTITLFGQLLDHEGNIWTNEQLSLPPVFSGSAGLYLLGDKAITTDTGTNIFLNIVGRMPFAGEQVIQISGPSTYLGNGMWDSVPTLNLGYAAFLKIQHLPPNPLIISLAGDQAVISWPSSLSNWTLWTNNDFAGETWGKYTGPIVNNTVTTSTSAGNLFFRLSFP
jgi:hypothetical protein